MGRSVLVVARHPVLLSLALIPMLCVASPRAAAEYAPARSSEVSRILEEPIFGSRVYVAEAGVGHPFSVVLVHGAGEDGAQVWSGLVPVLAQKYHVVTFDLPGFGRSSSPDAVYSPANYAAFVKWAVDRFVSGRFALIGHSLGGAIAIRFAAKYPERMDRLILADVAGVLHRMALTKEMLRPDLENRGPSTAAVPLRYIDGLVKSALARLPSLSVDLNTVVETPYLREKLLSNDPGKIAALSLSEDDLTQAIYSIRAPTLVLWGSTDEVASLRTASLLAESISDARLKIFEGAGHEPMREQPGRFNAAVMDWLSGRAGEKAAAPRANALASRIGRCDGERGAAFTGPYQIIDINDCNDVSISGATAEHVNIINSSVDIQNSRIQGAAVGLFVRSSTVTMTGVKIEGSVAIRTSESRLDLAGVQLVGSRSAVSTQDHSNVLFSICLAQSPNTRSYLHGAWELTPDTSL